MVRSSEIQGLRALAVILVLLFHADWLPGGYIGVDIFYVISGYLITTLIINDRQFSFANFYARRAKRLLPTAYLVLAITGILFWQLAPGISKIQFSKDLLASIWYVSNYNFAYWQNDYQNLGAEPSVLIHYWSLAVEEQFYLLWPIFLLLFRKRLKAMVVVVTLGSLLLSVLVIEIAPIWAFYSLPTRAFELTIGALISLQVSKQTKIKKITDLFASSSGPFSLKVLSSYVLVGLLLLTALIFDETTYFPGLPALIPTTITALLITINAQNAFLRLSIFQKIGDWSYSIYLWHWPLLILPEIYFGRFLSNLEKILVLIICILLGAFTYRYYENPIRIKQVSNRLIFIGTFLGALFLSSIALLNQLSGASAAKTIDLDAIRVEPIIYQDGCQLDKEVTRPRSDCIYGDTSAEDSVVLLGDSHAAQWFPVIDKWAKARNFKLIVMTKSSCPAAILDLRDKGGFKAANCREFQRQAALAIDELKPRLLIAGSAENHKYVNPEQYLNLPKVSSKILVLKDTPWPNKDIPTCLSKYGNLSEGNSLKGCDVNRPKSIPYPGYESFDPIPLMCNSLSCPAVIEGVVAYRDHSHISVAMALSLYEDLAEKLDRAVAR